MPFHVATLLHLLGVGAAVFAGYHDSSGTVLLLWAALAVELALAGLVAAQHRPATHDIWQTGRRTRAVTVDLALAPEGLVVADRLVPWEEIEQVDAGPGALRDRGGTIPSRHPRALAVTVVAVPAQHRAVQLPDGGGAVVFTTTDVDALDARPEPSSLGRFLVTTPEQTFVDLLARPELGGLPAEAAAAARALRARISPDRTRKIAEGRARTVARRVEEALA